MNNLHAQNFRLNSTRMRVSSKILSNNNDVTVEYQLPNQQRIFLRKITRVYMSGRISLILLPI